MKMSRRSAIISGALATTAVAGLLLVGPAVARGHDGPQQFGMMGPANGTSDPATSDPNGFDGPRGMMFGAGRTIHSEGVSAQQDSSGGTTYITVRTQTGKVTAASDSSITLKSDDGYTSTWSITASTVVSSNGSKVKASSFKVGDVLSASGTVSNGAATASFIGTEDFGMMGRGRGDRGHGMMGDDDANTGGLAPVPSSSASA